MRSLELTPVNYQSSLILQKGEFAFVGISPFNSYFSVEKIIRILRTVADNFDDFAIFIPDQISRHTLEALGYQKNIHQKIRRQDNYLKNKAKRALIALENEEISNEDQEDLVVLKSSSRAHIKYVSSAKFQLKQHQPMKSTKYTKDKIITLSSLLDNTQYLQSYNLLMDRFNTNDLFRNGCIRTSSDILANHNKEDNSSIDETLKQDQPDNWFDNPIVDNKALMIGVQYFLKELPLFLHAPAILNVRSCCFIYSSIPAFLTEIYNDYNLASINQGFAVYEDE